jgi:hypothetical protein
MAHPPDFPSRSSTLDHHGPLDGQTLALHRHHVLLIKNAGLVIIPHEPAKQLGMLPFVTNRPQVFRLFPEKFHVQS